MSFVIAIADALLADSADLGARWLTQARNVAPRVDGDVPAPAAGADVVRRVACVLRDDPLCHDGVMRAGWEFGAAAHAAGESLHYMLKELHLLTAMLLYAAERAAAPEGPAAGAGAAGAFAAARKIHKAVALLTLAAAKGFTHAYVGALQDHYRLLRHDMRNPLGTIKSAVSFMEDASVPEAMRNSPRYRGMITRNAQSLEVLIGAQLSDASTHVPAFGQQEVSLGDVALVVRRDLREEAAERGCTVEPDASLPTVLVDSTTFELSLKSATSAALRSARAGSRVAIALEAHGPRTATVVVSYEADPAAGDDPGVAGALDFARDLAALSGGRVWGGPGAVYIEVSLFPADGPAPAVVAAAVAAAPTGA